MQRRTFVKALIFTAPALWINPIYCLSKTFSLDTARLPDQEFVIYFIGDYGKRVLAEFRQLRRAYPVLKQCDHVSMDVNSEDGFVQVSASDNLSELIAKSINSEVVCFVMDACQPDAVALAESICGIGKRSGNAIYLCLSPVLESLIGRDTFNMAVETNCQGVDQSAHLLLVLWNAYLGCGSMGSLQCLKYLFDVMELRRNHYRALAYMATQKGNPNQIDVEKLVSDLFRGNRIWQVNNNIKGSFYGMLEINPSENHALPIYASVMERMEQTIGDQEHGLIVRLSMRQNEVRLTMFNLDTRAS